MYFYAIDSKLGCGTSPPRLLMDTFNVAKYANMQHKSLKVSLKLFKNILALFKEIGTETHQCIFKTCNRHKIGSIT
jgi:hypothetical protein